VGSTVILIVNARLTVAGTGAGVADRAEPITLLEQWGRRDEIGRAGEPCRRLTFFLLLERQMGAGIRRRDVRGRRSRESAARTYMRDKPSPWAMRSSCHDSPVSGETRSPTRVLRWSTDRTWVDGRRISGESVNVGDHSGGFRIITHNFSFTGGVVSLGYI